jgi:Putative transposase
MLPVPYFHIVFTLPHELSALVLQNKQLLYDLLFRTSAASLLELARDPKRLGADIGFLGVLHTWGQNLQVHPHVHYIVPAGGLALDGSRWVDSSRKFFLPVKALSPVFAGKFCDELRELYKQDRLKFHKSIEQLASSGHSAASSGNSARRTGSYTLSHPSAVPNTFSTTWRATLIASPSPTIGSWPSRTIAYHSAGETMPTAAKRRS